MKRKLKKATETATETTSTATAAPVAASAALAKDLGTGLAFTVDRKEFAAVLRKLAPVAPKGKCRLPMLQTVLIRATPEAVVMATTDLNVWAVYSAPAWAVHDSGAICVNLKALADVVAKLEDGPITLRGGALAALTLGITSGNAHVDLQALNPRDYPKVPAVTGDDAPTCLSTVDAGTLRELIEATEHAICKDSTRFHLAGIAFEYDGVKARMVATDGHRLALAQRDMPRAGDFATEGLVIIPAAACVEIRKLCKGDGTVDLGYVKHAGVRMLAAHRSGLILVCKLVDAQFPPYEQVIPKDNRRLVTVDRRALLDTLKRAAPICSETKGVTLTMRARGIEAPTLTIEASHADKGTIRETLAAETRPDIVTATIAVNPKYLIAACEAVGGDRVTLAISDDETKLKSCDMLSYQLNPIVVRCTADAALHSLMESPRLVVVMPMRM